MDVILHTYLRKQELLSMTLALKLSNIKKGTAVHETQGPSLHLSICNLPLATAIQRFSSMDLWMGDEGGRTQPFT